MNVVKKVDFAKKPAKKKAAKGKKKAAPDTSFNFGANVVAKGKRRGGKGGGS